MKRMVYCIILVLILTGTTVLCGQESIHRDQILHAGKEWTRGHEEFEPDEDLIATLKARAKAGEDLRVDVYLALWCHDSAVHVPPFIKIMDQLDPGTVKIRYFTCQRKGSREQKYYVEPLKVTRIPTFIFYRGQKEIGRIVETPGQPLLGTVLYFFTL